jgi:hypothetical protein
VRGVRGDYGERLPFDGRRERRRGCKAVSTFEILPGRLAPKRRVCEESAHAATTGHAVVASAEPGESWLHCYPHDALFDA